MQAGRGGGQASKGVVEVNLNFASVCLQAGSARTGSNGSTAKPVTQNPSLIYNIKIATTTTSLKFHKTPLAIVIQLEYSKKPSPIVTSAKITPTGNLVSHHHTKIKTIILSRLVFLTSK